METFRFPSIIVPHLKARVTAKTPGSRLPRVSVDLQSDELDYQLR